MDTLVDEEDAVPGGEERFLHRLDLMATPRAWEPLARRGEEGSEIDLLQEPHDRLPVHRFVLLLLFQLTVKDRATELRFEPSRFPVEPDREFEGVGFRVFYEVDGQLHELVPPPWQMMPDFAREIESLAGLRGGRSRMAHLLRRLADRLDGQAPGPRCGGFALRLGASRLRVQVLAYPGELGERYFLKVESISAALSEQAQAAMKRIVDRDRRSAGEPSSVPPSPSEDAMGEFASTD